MEKLLKDIYKLEPASHLSSQISSITDEQMMKEDENHLDLLHHSILAKHPNVAQLLLTRGYFTNRHQPSVYPYVSLACYIGSKVVLPCLAEFRKSDFTVKVNINIFNQLNGIGDSGVTEKTLDQNDDELELLPIEIAAIRGHAVSCINSVIFCEDLDDGPKAKSIAQKAVELDSVILLNYAFKNSVISQDEMNVAFKDALIGKKHMVLEILLDEYQALGTTDSLQGLNAFHILYTYSMNRLSIFQSSQGLVECTKALLKHNIDANVKYPFGSFPLYSLLASVGKYESPGINFYHYTESLKCLLGAVENADFDEIAEQRTIEEESKANDDLLGVNEKLMQAVGRDIFSSPWEPLFLTFDLVSFDNTLSLYFKEASKILIDHGASMNHSGTDLNTPLHILMEKIGSHYGCEYTRTMMEEIMTSMLQAGSNPNAKSENGLTPAMSYFSSVFYHMSPYDECWEGLHLGCCCSGPVVKLISLMDYAEKIEVSYQILDGAHTIRFGGFGESPFEGQVREIENDVRESLKTLVSLVDLACLCTWKHLGRNRKNLSKTGLPNALQNRILSLMKM